jgi:hypothetical protein
VSNEKLLLENYARVLSRWLARAGISVAPATILRWTPREYNVAWDWADDVIWREIVNLPPSNRPAPLWLTEEQED